jgi:hypothetical protein
LFSGLCRFPKQALWPEWFTGLMQRVVNIEGGYEPSHISDYEGKNTE